MSKENHNLVKTEIEKNKLINVLYILTGEQWPV